MLALWISSETFVRFDTLSAFAPSYPVSEKVVERSESSDAGYGDRCTTPFL